MKPNEVIMESPDGESRTEVNNNESVAIMEGQGWKVVEGKKSKAAKAGPKSDADEEEADTEGMTKDQLKELLDAKGIVYENKATKADLLELLHPAE